jgi:hypothetical protein
MTALELAVATRHFLSSDIWSKHGAQDKRGERVAPMSPDAVRFSYCSAITRVAGEYSSQAVDEVRTAAHQVAQARGWSTAWTYNSDPRITYEDVMGLADDVIARLTPVEHVSFWARLRLSSTRVGV